MKAVIKPSKAKGEIKIPPSKSMAHRAIICAGLSDGISVIDNIDYSDDIIATIQCMRKLGADISCEKNKITVKGIKDFSGITDRKIQSGESGSTLRFMIPLFSLTGQKISFYGKNRLLKRPQNIYKEIFEEQHLLFEHKEECIEVCGALSAGRYTISGSVSSQFISGLLFCLPLLNEDSEVFIVPPFESKSYVEMTIQMLKKFGIDIVWKGENNLYIKGKQKYIPHNETIEGDFSQFAFFAVLSAVNNPIKIYGMDSESIQGDKNILNILKNFGCNITYADGAYVVSSSKLCGAQADIGNCPDLGPILCVLAMFSNGISRIYNAGRLRLKESDRILAMKTECAKMGCCIEDKEQKLMIKGEYCTPKNSLCSWKDHRIVMACAVALSVLGGEIDGCEAISKSYPSFFDDLKSVGIDVNLHD